MNIEITTNKRESNVELLRIICMVFIVMQHYAVHGFMEGGYEYSTNKYVVDFLAMWGQIGVNGFILISGYYMVNLKLNPKKILLLCGQIWFYSIGMLLIFLYVLTPVDKITVKEIIKSFLPILYSEYWFATSYIVLMLISPFLNIFITNIQKINYRRLIILLTIIWCILPTFMKGNLALSNLGWFVMLYLIAGYLRLYGERVKVNAKRHLISAGIFSSILVCSFILLNFIGHHFNIELFLENSTCFKDKNNLVIIVITLELFLGFLSMKVKSNKYINLVAKATFGVYLIHDNIILRPYLWKIVFNNAGQYDSKFLILHAIFTIAAIYIVCTIIDLLRQKTIEKVWVYIIDKEIQKVIIKICNFILIVLKIGKKHLNKYYKISTH